MMPTHSPSRSIPLPARRFWPVITLTSLLLGGCEQNTFQPPPPPKVDVAKPVQRAVTRYLEATGNTAPVKSVDLVARVQGFLQSIDYKDGETVKEGTQLFTIERRPTSSSSIRRRQRRPVRRRR
jgi:multidrug efflux pump subunit AcrA (membrane-fusion protein)